LLDISLLSVAGNNLGFASFSIKNKVYHSIPYNYNTEVTLHLKLWFLGQWFKIIFKSYLLTYYKLN